MTDELKKLVNKRNSISKKVERLYNIAIKIEKEGDINDNYDNFLVRFDSLSEQIRLFGNIHLEIVSLCESDKFDEHEKAEETFDDMQYAIKSICKSLIEKRDDKKEFQANNDNESVRSDRCERVRLPKIEIPKFDGDMKKWPTFFDMFRTLIHECSSLSNIERFQYLISYLEKDAATVVKNIPITEDNYTIAYACLVKRYQNERVLITNYWLNVYKAESMKNNNAPELRKLLSNFSENLSALNQFNAINLWDFTKLNLLLQKLDPSLKTSFEVQYSDKAIPTYENLFVFLEKQCRAMENSQLFSKSIKPTFPQNMNDKSKKFGQTDKNNTFVSTYFTKGEQKCNFCKSGNHSLLKCDKFLSADVEQRHSFIKVSRLCFNCFSSSHGLGKCDSRFRCRVCGKGHHSLLHFPKNKRDNVDQHVGAPGDSSQEETNSDGLKVLTSTLPLNKSVLFATAVVCIQDQMNRPIQCRVLLDSASQTSFISDSCVRRLGLQKTESTTPIQGLNQMSMCASLGNVNLNISSCINPSFTYNLDCIVLSNICGALPSATVSCRKWKFLNGLSLADPRFNVPGDVDVLLGVEFFSQIILPGFKKGQNGGLCAMNSTLGWVLFGSVESLPPKDVLSYFTTMNCAYSETDKVLQRFWELESVPTSSKTLSIEEQSCESNFVKTCERDEAGRYTVDLPFCVFPPTLGDSRTQSLRRYYSLELKLHRNPDLKILYHEFMKDYLDQGHMQLVDDLPSVGDGYFIPHHCVVKGEKEETKIRVVFDASCKTSNGASLNDNVLTGPKLQADIACILLNFRIFPIVFTTDIRQMYRQIMINKNHRDFQRILWRFSSCDAIQEYQLNTVTYGVSSSPYLAIRTLLQLVNDCGDKFPLASEAIKHNCYVDDIMGGAFSVEEAIALQRELITLLELGKFELRKWASNCPTVLEGVPSSHQQPISLNDHESSGVKVLGLQWCPVTDSFSYSVVPSERECTKRNILSEIARIYDVVGFLCPVVLMAKGMIQKLWAQGLDWDDTPSLELVTQWKTYKDQLPLLSSLSIPRQIVKKENGVTQLHGFCDASEVAYAAVVYIRQISSDNDISVSLVCAKSKVSPLKRVSLPRLELCAASLLAELVEVIVNNLRGIHIDQIFAWSDSTVALAWIRSSPHKWKTFVANRVSLIQDKIPPNCWSHVDGKTNPADCASRGLFPEQLISHSLWWAGPPWLKNPCHLWPSSGRECHSEEVACEERKTVLLTTNVQNVIVYLLERFSSLRKIQGIVAYCLRFKPILRRPLNQWESKALSYDELYAALLAIVKVIQTDVFADDWAKIKKSLPCSKPLRQLVPFIDDSGVLRVGGRLRNSELSYDAKHPILLPRDHRLTQLIILQFHIQNCHPGPRGLQYLIIQQFWILSARRAIRCVLSKCYRCFRVNPTSLTPLMGDLPPARVSQVKAFSNSGVDFAGPVLITLGKHRGIRTQKAYICVFICLVTKALHLEVVSDLTSEAFLAAFRRFVARRGRCSDLFSDRGTNFVGANKILKTYCENACESLTIRWHFNPPASPHFGGIWEAAVKSVKTNLIRVIGIQILTFEELSTVLAQIEAVLNSRPLCSLSPDPNDLNSLTPGHFLTMEPLTAPPDDNLLACKMNRLSRWQLVQQLHQHFWRRWHVEYLHTLQQRQKWNTVESPPSIGTLVVIKDLNVVPMRWPLGRIVKLYPSPDKVARIAQVRTAKGLIDRPLVKLCPLPVQ